MTDRNVGYSLLGVTVMVVFIVFCKINTEIMLEKDICV